MTSDAVYRGGLARLSGETPESIGGPPVHVAFERQTTRRPNAAAVENAHRSLRMSYSELNGRANQVALAILDRLGNNPGRIGLVLEDEADALAGVLGVWKAGKTAVPLDTSNPAARLESLLLQAGAEGVVVRQSTSMTEQVAQIEMTSLPLDSGNPGLEVALDSPARIMYTSGSTGSPKGVVHSHRFLLSKVADDIRANGFSSADRLSQTLPLSFAASTSHSLGALVNGGTLCIYNPSLSGLHPLGDWIRSERITGLQLAPGLFRRFCEQLSPEVQFSTPRYLIVGGDRVLGNDVELFRRHFDARSVFVNRFAATECGPIARFEVRSDDPLPPTVLPLGTALPGRRIVIEDADGEGVAAGETGEIVIHGDSLADGYWNDSELTNAAFGLLPDGTRFYRTGDQGRFNHAGQLEHAGRADERVKIHGFGVDLLEVEKTMLAHPLVKEVATTMTPTEVGDDALIAYVVPRSGVEFASSDLRTDLLQQLPRFSVPRDFVVLDAMPLTQRGKLDRLALPPWAPLPTGEDSTQARSEKEHELVGLFEQVLGVEGVGVRDDFWALGGTSMQALVLFAAISDRFGEDLAPTALIDAPDVESLLQAIEAGRASDLDRIVVPIRRDGSGPPLICVHGGGGGVFFARDISLHLRFDQRLYAVQAEGFEGTPPPYQTVEDIAQRYAGEIVKVIPQGPYMLCGLSFGGLVAIEIARTLRAGGADVTFLGLIDTKHPSAKVDLDEGMGRHANRISGLGTTAKVRYVASGAWKRLVKRPLHRRRVNRYLREGRPFPADGRLRNLHFFTIHSRASREYQPSHIEVPMHILSEHGEGEEQQRMWAPVATAGLDIHEVSGDHHSLISTAVVEEVAAWLQENADRAGSAETSAS